MRYPIGLNTALDSAITAYSGLQSVLSFVQKTNSSSASTIYKVQKVMGFLDGAEVLGNGARTYLAYKKRYGNERSDRLDWKPLAAMGVGAIGLAAVAYAINVFFRPNLNLGSLLSGIAPNLQNANLSFSAPFVQIVLQWLFLMRISLNVALACLSPEKGLKLFSAGFQTLSLFNISSLKWIKFQRSYETPLKNVAFSANLDIPNYANAIRRADTSMYFMVPRPAWSGLKCATPQSHYENAVKKIVDFSDHLFENSEWLTYSRTRTEYYGNGIYAIVPELVTRVKAKAANFQNCFCGGAPKLTDWDIRIRDSFMSASRRVSSLSFK